MNRCDTPVVSRAGVSLAIVSLAAALVGIASLPGCTSAELAPAVVQTRTGPPGQKPIRRVVALRATCGALTTVRVKVLSQRDDSVPAVDRSSAIECRELYIDGVDAIVRSLLDFLGYEIIDSELVNATTLARMEIETREWSKRSWGTSETTTRETELVGSRFIDAPPAIQDEILAQLKADGVLTTRIRVGAGIGSSSRRDIEVQVRMLHMPGGELAWASRCRVEAGLETNEEPIMKAARCATEAVNRP